MVDGIVFDDRIIVSIISSRNLKKKKKKKKNSRFIFDYRGKMMIIGSVSDGRDRYMTCCRSKVSVFGRELGKGPADHLISVVIGLNFFVLFIRPR